MTELIAKHGGYKTLKSFQATEIIYDLTVDFCRRYIPSFKLKDQIEGAARSASVNIAEGSKNSGTSKQTEIRLVEVARGSQEELQRDMLSFLRQNNLQIWDKNNPKSKEIRQLAYATDRSHKTYESYMASPESAANCLLCISHQACFLLDQQLKALGKDLVEGGDFKERYKEVRKEKMFNIKDDYDEFLKSQGLRRLENGRVVKLDE